MDVQQSAQVLGIPQSTQPLSPPPVSDAPVVQQPVSSPPQSHSKNIFWRWVIATLLALTVVVVGIYMYVSKGVIEIGSQFPGRTIRVDRVVNQRPVFLVILKVSAIDGIEIVAVSSLLTPEEYLAFELPIFDNLEDLRPGDQLVATFYDDSDGDTAFDMSVDKSARNIFGFTPRVTFFVQ